MWTLWRRLREQLDPVQVRRVSLRSADSSLERDVLGKDQCLVNCWRRCEFHPEGHEESLMNSNEGLHGQSWKRKLFVAVGHLLGKGRAWLLGDQLAQGVTL